MWDYATQLAQESQIKTSEIMHKKAMIQRDKNDLVSAASTFIDIGEFMQAIEILGSHGSFDKLMDLVRRLNKSDTRELQECARYFKTAGLTPNLIETLLKLGDISSLMKVYVESNQWEEAFGLLETHPQFSSEVYLPYADWLSAHDRFMEAQVYYRKAGQMDAATQVLLKLTLNAVTEQRYEDGTFYILFTCSCVLLLVP